MQEPERTSRQELVHPPRQSSLPLVLGTILCAGTGFGLVWALGIGRATGGGEAPAQASLPTVTVSGPEVAFTPQETYTPAHDGEPSSAQTGNAPRQPSRFPQANGDADSPRAMNEPGWRQPSAPLAAPPEDRYPTRPATLETPEPVTPAQDGRSSRFAPVDRFPGTGSEPVQMASVELASLDAQPAPPPADAESADTYASSDVPVSSSDAAASQSGSAQPADEENALLPPSPSDVADAPASPPLLPASPEPEQLQESPTEDTALAPPPPQSRAATAPSPPPRGFTSTDLAPPASFRPAAIAPVPPPAPPPSSVPAPVISTTATNPFASAPPMGPPPARRATPSQGGGSFPSGAAGAALPETAGQGRPGPIQLEGLQTPQLAVEKRGPREIQVGKPVRYEILVRNVGNATAQDVTLRDAVPYGTTLIATTPPASPASAGPTASHGLGGTAAELVWPLGTLNAGGEARVSMEVMPQIEGEIGSVASVSFRTEASVRSRATKPDLRLEASEPQTVRIGGDVKLSMKVSNPGTGIATGVILEGTLPDGVSHSAGRELEFDVGQLRPGESRTIDLVLGSTGPGVHSARFAARADGQIEVTQPVRIEITAPTLELSTQMPSRRYLQRPATCVLSMVNAGTAPARSVELAAQLPPGMKFVRANHAGWYEERSHRVLWNLEELPPGEVGTVEMVLMPVDLGPQKIVAAARSSDGPSDQTMHTVEVEGLAALFFEVTDSEDPIEVGGVTEYIVRIGNQGTKAAGGVRLTATLLGDLEPVEAKGPAAYRVENLAVIFEPLAKLAPSEEAVFRVRVRGRREGDQRMQVQLVSDDHPAPITKEEITRVYADR